MTSSSGDDPVAKHFDSHALDFDSIYESRKPTIRSVRDRLTRGTVVQRLEFIDKLADGLRPRRVLDVGCGSGRFCVRLAERGADVIGIDFAPEMLRLAEEKARDAGVANRCRFLQEDFMTWDWDEPFDLVLAIGVLDYVHPASPFVARLANATRGTAVISFPQRLHPLVPVRFVRLKLAGCPVFFYDRADVEALGRDSFRSWEVKPFRRDYLLMGKVA